MAKRNGKLTCLYLYADGHAVYVYEKDDPDAGHVRYVDVEEKIGPEMDFQPCGHGRLIVSHPGKHLLAMLRKAKSIRARVETLESGSDNSKRMGLATGSVTLYMNGPWGDDSFRFLTLNGVISGQWTVQPNIDESWDDLKDSYYWGHEPIRNRISVQ